MRAAVCLAAALAAFGSGVYLAATTTAWWGWLLACLAYIGGLGLAMAGWIEAGRERG